MKTSLLLLLILIWPQSDLGIASKYDRFKDETLYRVTESLMPDRPGYVLLSFRTTYKGENPRLTRPSSVVMLLTSYTDIWYFQRTDNTVRVIQDGERYELGRMRIVSSDITENGVIEHLALDVPISSLEKISRATKFEMQIGRYEVALKPEAVHDIKRWLDTFQ